MKKRMIFFALVLSLIFLSVGSIYANDIDGNFSESANVVLYNVDNVSADDFASINNDQHVELEDSVADNLVTKSSQSESVNSDDGLSIDDELNVNNNINDDKDSISDSSSVNQSNNSSSIVSENLNNSSQFNEINVTPEDNIVNIQNNESFDVNHFNSSDIHSSNPTVTIEDIKDASTNLKEYIEKHGVMPNYVTVGGVKFSIPQFLYLMAQALINIDSGISSDIVSIDVSSPDFNTGDDFHGSIYIDEFLTMAKSIVDSITATNKAPNSISSSLGDVKYETLVYMFSKIVSYINTHSNQIPQMVYISNLLDYYNLTVTMYPSVSSDYQYIKYVTTWLNYCPQCGYYGTLLINPKGTYEGELTCDHCDCDFCGVTGKEKISGSTKYLTRLSPTIPASEVSTDKVTVDDVVDAAVYVKEYLASHGVLPGSVTINGKE